LPPGSVVVVESATHQFNLVGSVPIRDVLERFLRDDSRIVDRISLPPVRFQCGRRHQRRRVGLRDTPTGRARPRPDDAVFVARDEIDQAFGSANDGIGQGRCPSSDVPRGSPYASVLLAIRGTRT
jgi:hypothetical protein